MNSPSTTFSNTSTGPFTRTSAKGRCAAPSLNSPSLNSLTSSQDRRGAPQAEAATDSARHADPFAARFGKSLPRGLRLEADHMTWPAFEAAYAPAAGPLRLANWTEERISSARTRFTATLDIDHARRLATANATGPISAMTAILHEAGYPMEVTSFHQQQASDKTATFIHCTDGRRSHWAMGIGENCTESILRAFISAANLLGNP